MTKKQKISSNMPEIWQKIITDSQIRKEVCKRSHWWFFLVYLARYVTKPTATFQKEIFNITEDNKIKMATIVAFRGSGKSTIVSLSYPMWSILGKEKKKFVLIIGRTQNQTNQHLKNIKQELENNELLRKDMGPFAEEKTEWSNASLVFPKHNARIMAVSMDQSIRGIRHAESRPDLIICDDIEDMKSVKTRKNRDKTFDWLTSEIIPAGDQNTKMIIIGNLLHADSVVMRFKKRIETKQMHGVYREYPLLNGNNECLWQGKYPTKTEIDEERKKVGNEIAWQREFLLNIVPDDGQVIQNEWIQYYDELPTDKNESDYIAQVCIGVDLAISQSETADYTAMVPIIGFLVQGQVQMYVLPSIINQKMTFLETQNKAEALYETYLNDVEWKPKLVVEDVGYQRSLVEVLEEKRLNVKGIKTNGQDKRARLVSISHYLEKGQVFFPNNQESEKLVQQLVGFGVEHHDDLVDAFVYAVMELMENPPRKVYFVVV